MNREKIARRAIGAAVICAILFIVKTALFPFVLFAALGGALLRSSATQRATPENSGENR